MVKHLGDHINKLQATYPRSLRFLLERFVSFRGKKSESRHGLPELPGPAGSARYCQPDPLPWFDEARLRFRHCPAGMADHDNL